MQWENFLGSRYVLRFVAFMMLSWVCVGVTVAGEALLQQSTCGLLSRMRCCPRFSFVEPHKSPENIDILDFTACNL